MTRKSDKSIFYRTIPSHKQMMAFITLVTRRSPDILLSFYQIIVFLNLVREKKKKIVFYILQICMSRKLLEDPIFTFYFTFISFIVFFVLFFFRSD
jgi:hypothetical protein